MKTIMNDNKRTKCRGNYIFAYILKIGKNFYTKFWKFISNLQVTEQALNSSTNKTLGDLINYTIKKILFKLGGTRPYSTARVKGECYLSPRWSRMPLFNPQPFGCKPITVPTEVPSP